MWNIFISMESTRSYIIERRVSVIFVRFLLIHYFILDLIVTKPNPWRLVFIYEKRPRIYFKWTFQYGDNPLSMPTLQVMLLQIPSSSLLKTSSKSKGNLLSQILLYKFQQTILNVNITANNATSSERQLYNVAEKALVRFRSTTVQHCVYNLYVDAWSIFVVVFRSSAWKFNSWLIFLYRF